MNVARVILTYAIGYNICVFIIIFEVLMQYSELISPGQDIHCIGHTTMH